jgi:hypothetical protein
LHPWFRGPASAIWVVTSAMRTGAPEFSLRAMADRSRAPGSSLRPPQMQAGADDTRSGDGRIWSRHRHAPTRSCGWRRGRPVCEDGTVASGLVLAGAGCDTGQSRRVLGRIGPGAARCGSVQPGTRVCAGISGLYRGGGCSHRGNRLCAGDTLNGAPMNPVGCAEYRARAGHIYCGSYIKGRR